jgi:SagB-type dehydrogenase family enzyme
MTEALSLLTWTELDATTMPALAERIALASSEPLQPRSYPGYPTWPLDRVRPRRLASLDRALIRRQCHRELTTTTPSRRLLSRLLYLAHGATRPHLAGPTPSAGGVQALELYLVHWTEDWLPAGLYHYDRSAHHLAQLAPDAPQAEWRQLVPSLEQVAGGSLLWVLIGDEPRCAVKYGDRAARFLLLEAGHLMQNLCLLSASLGLSTVPLGGYLEREIADAFLLPATDRVLYVGVCGFPASSAPVG